MSGYLIGPGTSVSLEGAEGRNSYAAALAPGSTAQRLGLSCRFDLDRRLLQSEEVQFEVHNASV